MVIDTSALIAVLLAEPSAQSIARVIADAPLRLFSAPNLLEASIVIERRNRDAGAQALDNLIYRTGIEIVPADYDLVEVARRAWRRFGKGRHPASLNYGDCFAYALAKSRGLPLLFVGDDFSQTDIEPVRLE